MVAAKVSLCRIYNSAPDLLTSSFWFKSGYLLRFFVMTAVAVCQVGGGGGRKQSRSRVECVVGGQAVGRAIPRELA